MISLRVPAFATALLFVVQSSAAARTQAQLTPTFKDRDGPAVAASSPATACPLRFGTILDERRSPEIVGVIDGRGVLAPKDPAVWLRAVLKGLRARGIEAVVDEEGPSAAAPAATFALQTAWISSAAVTYNANVVVRVKVQGDPAKALDKAYRGRSSRTAYWSMGVDTMQSAVDGAFADALDAMAADLKAFCSAGVGAGGPVLATRPPSS